MISSNNVISTTPLLRVAPGYTEIEPAILRTVAYADVFDYPLNAGEIWRYLVGVKASPEEVNAALENSPASMPWLHFKQGYYTLKGRQELVEVRRGREAVAQRRWPAARRYGMWIAAMPFVRMVALTGAMAVSNEEGPDLDYLVVTTPGRLWLCRGMVMLLVHWARRYGDEICPNFFLTENVLTLADRNLYTAHELAQMVPLSGFGVYWRMRTANPWVATYLPNAAGAPFERTVDAGGSNGLISVTRQSAEWLLWTAAGDWVERWEMNRKVRKLRSQVTAACETDFCADRCKGHFGGYGRKTRAAYDARLQAMGLQHGLWEAR